MYIGIEVFWPKIEDEKSTVVIFRMILGRNHILGIIQVKSTLSRKLSKSAPLVSSMVLAVRNLIVGRGRVVRPGFLGHDLSSDSLKTYISDQGSLHTQLRRNTHLKVMKVQNLLQRRPLLKQLSSSLILVRYNDLHFLHRVRLNIAQAA